MPAQFYIKGLLELAKGTYNFGSPNLKLMLLKTTYVFDRTHSNVGELSPYEITADNYARGYGGSGRMRATVVPAQDNTVFRVKFTISNVTWALLGSSGAGQNDTVKKVALIFETGGSDGRSIPVAFIGITTTTTDGTDFIPQFDQVNGNLSLFVLDPGT